MNSPEASAELLEATGRWRARDVSYWAGRWDRLSRLVPKFSIEPFKAHPEAPANPHMKAVVRQPLSVTEQLIPVGTVSNSYQLAQHHEVVNRCFEGLQSVGIETTTLKCEVGLTPLGEWMNFRAYFPNSKNHIPKDGKPLGLRLECFNSVDGSCRLVILFSWLRLVCSNGLVIGETKAELRDIHDEHLNLDAIPEIIATGMLEVTQDIIRMEYWDKTSIDPKTLEKWANDDVTKKWGKKAACRVFHICQSGCDADIIDPFAKGDATEKPVKLTIEVPGAARPSKTLYDVSQALSWVATQRNNTEERVDWQAAIPKLVGALVSKAA